MELYYGIKMAIFFGVIAFVIIAISIYTIKALITWIYLKMCRARKRRIEWMMKRQEEKERKRKEKAAKDKNDSYEREALV